MSEVKHYGDESFTSMHLSEFLGGTEAKLLLQATNLEKSGAILQEDVR